MSAEEKVLVLRDTLERIRESCYGEFQDLPERPHRFRRDKHICPVCLRTSSPEHVREAWARIQALAAEGLRLTDDVG